MSIDALPKVGAKAWFTLRAKAATAPSTRFTASFVAAALGMANPDSAQANIVRPMRALGIFEEDGTLTDLGNRWRNESTYPDACQEILDKVYPKDFASLTDQSGQPSADQVRSWLTHNGFGDSNARQMTTTYVMIATKKIASDPPPSEVKKAVTSKKPTKQVSPKVQGGQVDDSAKRESLQHEGGPGIHLDIQIHMPADASAEQIDAIFRSMAKHIYGRVAD